MIDNGTLGKFARLLESVTGLRSPESNFGHLRRAIAREERKRGISAGDLLNQAKTDRDTLQAIIDMAMIGETYFFREVAHFRFLLDRVIPGLCGPGAPGLRRARPVAVWSASCSTGEEAVSLAALFAESLRRSGVWNGDASGLQRLVTVYASDIRSDVQERIRRGVYPLSSFRRDGEEFHFLLRKRYVTPFDDRSITVVPDLLDIVVPIHLNLFADSFTAIPDDLDIVFFRNTLIYAPATNRDAIVDRIVRKIRPGGYLFLANSELPFITHAELELIEDGGTYVLRRIAPSVPARGNGHSLRRDPAIQEDASDRTRTSPEPARVETSLSVIEVLRAVRDLANPAESSSTDVPAGATETVADAVFAMFTDLDKGLMDKASRSLATICNLQPASALSHYCTGWYAYVAGESSASVAAFSAALDADPCLWPARFYRGKLTEWTNPAAARADFLACIAQINKNPSDEYRFLLGGFDSGQIQGLSRRLAARLETVSMERPHGS